MIQSFQSGVLSLLTAVLAVVFITSPAQAWSTKEHILLTRLAARRLLADPGTPPAMKAWLKRNLSDAPGDLEGEKEWFLTQHIGRFARGTNGLAFWAAVPDMVAAVDHRPVEPYGVSESKLHYIDLEALNPDPAKRTYAPDLSHKPAGNAFPADLKDPAYKRSGYLPFRLAQCDHRLVAAIGAGRLEDRPGQYPHDDHAVRWAGYLAHYIEDNTQPQHATVDYKARSYFPSDTHAPNIHWAMEYLMVDDDTHDYTELRKEYWPMLMQALEQVKDPATNENPWDSTIQIALYSYDALPLIGDAAVAAAKAANEPGQIDLPTFFHFKGTVDGRPMTVMQMKARQQALAVLRVQKFWLRAWRQATVNAAPKPMP